MTHITFDYKHALMFFPEKDIHAMQKKVGKILNQLHGRSKEENK